MINFFKNFSKDESGAVTVDFVVLTAAVVALAVVAFTQIDTAARGVATNTAGAISGGVVQQ